MDYPDQFGFRAAGNRCALDWNMLADLGNKAQLRAILLSCGFRPVAVSDAATIAQSRIGESQYRRGASPQDAPATVDCSSFARWVYGRLGIWIPRRSIQQSAYGAPVPKEGLAPGDLVFSAGRSDYYLADPADGIGHVGIVSACMGVIHAANSNRGIVEDPLPAFVAAGFRGGRRLIPAGADIEVFDISAGRGCVESSDDLGWIITQRL